MPGGKGNIKASDNPKPWKKGQSGNPDGYKAGVPNAKTRLKKFLLLKMTFKNPITEQDEELEVIEKADLEQIYAAINGDLAAYKEINDRLEGRPSQQTDMNVNFPGALKVEISEMARKPITNEDELPDE